MPIEKCTYNVNPYEWYNLQPLLQSELKGYFEGFHSECVALLKSEWPDCDTTRLCSHDNESDDVLPVSLILNELFEPRQSCYTVGHCRLVKVTSPPYSVLVESVVVKEDYRARGVGKILMDLIETCCKKMGYNTIYLVATADSEVFFSHIGYSGCSPVPTVGAQMLNTCKMSMEDGSFSETAESCSGPTECKQAKLTEQEDCTPSEATSQTQTTCTIWMKKGI